MNRPSSFDPNVTRAICVGRAELTQRCRREFPACFCWMSRALRLRDAQHFPFAEKRL